MEMNPFSKIKILAFIHNDIGNVFVEKKHHFFLFLIRRKKNNQEAFDNHCDDDDDDGLWQR